MERIWDGVKNLGKRIEPAHQSRLILYFTVMKQETVKRFVSKKSVDKIDFSFLSNAFKKAILSDLFKNIYY